MSIYGATDHLNVSAVGTTEVIDRHDMQKQQKRCSHTGGSKCSMFIKLSHY